MKRHQQNKRRYQLFLPEELGLRLETLAAQPGASKSAILVDAMTAWLDRQGASELELKFSHRLDRISMALGRLERDGHILLESLALFIRYELMISPPLADNDQAARALGQDRFKAFIDHVGEAVSSGRTTFTATEPAQGGGS